MLKITRIGNYSLEKYSSKTKLIFFNRKKIPRVFLCYLYVFYVYLCSYVVRLTAAPFIPFHGDFLFLASIKIVYFHLFLSLFLV